MLKRFTQFINESTKDKDIIFDEYIKESLHLDELNIRFDFIEYANFELYFYDDICVIQKYKTSMSINGRVFFINDIKKKVTELFGDVPYDDNIKIIELTIKQMFRQIFRVNYLDYTINFDVLSTKLIENHFNNDL